MGKADMQCVKVCGLTMDYWNEIPTDRQRRDAPHDWDWWHKKCDEERVRTYTQRYTEFYKEPEVVTASSPEKVARLDALVTELIQAGRARDIPTEQRILGELTDMYETCEKTHQQRR